MLVRLPLKLNNQEYIKQKGRSLEDISRIERDFEKLLIGIVKGACGRRQLISWKSKRDGSQKTKGGAESKIDGRSRIEVDRNQRREVSPRTGRISHVGIATRKNTIDDRIIDFGASFYATYGKEELERFKLRSSKVHLADDKTLDIVGVEDGVLKTSFGYNVGFEDQQWKVTKGSLVVAHGNKHRSLYMVKVPSDGINAAINGRGNAALWHQRLGHMSEKGMKILASKGMIPYLQKAVVGFCEPCILGKQKKADPATMLPLLMIVTRRWMCLKSDNGGEYSS
ncbi:retrovirus-related pol polyprotein from transposon TNT 1-94 [Tanacetum coccineum]